MDVKEVRRKYKLSKDKTFECIMCLRNLNDVVSQWKKLSKKQIEFLDYLLQQNQFDV